MSDTHYTSALEWLLEPDLLNPGVRYFALTDLLDTPLDTPEVVEARRRVMAHGPVPAILANQAEQGYWHQPDTLYYPKYQGSVWSIMFLAQLGADGSDKRIQRGCQYLLNHGRAPEPYEGFSYNGGPSGLLQCLQGNLVAALLDLGVPLDYLREELAKLPLKTVV